MRELLNIAYISGNVEHGVADSEFVYTHCNYFQGRVWTGSAALERGLVDALGGVGRAVAIAKKMVEKHGGSLWVESTLGQGATFYFTLPKSL